MRCGSGTEDGITEPQATFSACFGGAFLMWHPMKYAAMLADKMQQHGTHAWLVNTGWTGGKYGVGERMGIAHTRAIIDAIHSGEMDKVGFTETPIFKLRVSAGTKGLCFGLLHTSSNLIAYVSVCSWSNIEG